MTSRTLGKSGLVVSELGLGCMGMSEFYGAGDDAESIAVIHRAIDLGSTFLDTADMYGVGRNEKLVGGRSGTGGIRWCWRRNLGTCAGRTRNFWG